MSHFSSLFTTNGNDDMQEVLEKVESRVSRDMNDMLKAPYTAEEVKIALKHMHPTKASGRDGMPALFYNFFFGTWWVKMCVLMC